MINCKEYYLPLLLMFYSAFIVDLAGNIISNVH